MLEIEVANRSGGPVDEAGAVRSRGRCSPPRACARASSGSRSSPRRRCGALKREHLGVDEPTDVLSFPIDGLDALPEGEPRALGDVVLCPAVLGDDWRWPLVHGLLHLLGHEHGAEMEARERAHLVSQS